MGKETPIEWTDSTINPMVGCDGCELYNPKLEALDPSYKPECYAHTLVQRYAGHSKGYPEHFNKPKIFPDRIPAACKWKDLTGTDRPTKPWLNGMPRTIFLNDLGDTFTESLPLDWLAPFIPSMAASPHIWQILTKRPDRMKRFFDTLPFIPSNFWLGTSVTGPKTKGRLDDLLSIPGASLYFTSFEPVWDALDLTPYFLPYARPALTKLDWVIVGGQSGANAKPFDVRWAADVINQCREHRVRCFVKQFGARSVDSSYETGTFAPEDKRSIEAAACLGMDHIGFNLVLLKDKKGGDINEWEPSLRVREMP